MHGGTTWPLFYAQYGVDLQKRFFGHFLKGEDNGWDEQPRVLLRTRHVDGSIVQRDRLGWPLARDRAGPACTSTRSDARCARPAPAARPRPTTG